MSTKQRFVKYNIGNYKHHNENFITIKDKSNNDFTLRTISKSTIRNNGQLHEQLIYNTEIFEKMYISTAFLHLF